MILLPRSKRSKKQSFTEEYLLHRLTPWLSNVSIVISLKRREGIIMVEEKLTQEILACAMEVHSKLGPGLLESCYEECLCYELKQSGMRVEKQKPMPEKYHVFF